MARAEPYIRAALAQSDDLDEVFRLIHSARAADAARDAGSFLRRGPPSGM